MASSDGARMASVFFFALATLISLLLLVHAARHRMRGKEGPLGGLVLVVLWLYLLEGLLAGPLRAAADSSLACDVIMLFAPEVHILANNLAWVFQLFYLKRLFDGTGADVNMTLWKTVLAWVAVTATAVMAIWVWVVLKFGGGYRADWHGYKCDAQAKQTEVQAMIGLLATSDAIAGMAIIAMYIIQTRRVGAALDLTDGAQEIMSRQLHSFTRRITMLVACSNVMFTTGTIVTGVTDTFVILGLDAALSPLCLYLMLECADPLYDMLCGCMHRTDREAIRRLSTAPESGSKVPDFPASPVIIHQVSTSDANRSIPKGMSLSKPNTTPAIPEPTDVGVPANGDAPPR